MNDRSRIDRPRAQSAGGVSFHARGTQLRVSVPNPVLYLPVLKRITVPQVISLGQSLSTTQSSVHTPSGRLSFGGRIDGISMRPILFGGKGSSGKQESERQLSLPVHASPSFALRKCVL